MNRDFEKQVVVASLTALIERVKLFLAASVFLFSLLGLFSTLERDKTIDKKKKNKLK